jgi:hypothetical protein
VTLATPTEAQGLELDIIHVGIKDTEKVLQAYLEPFANILGSDLNAGWYNTARPHKLGGLDVTFTGNVSWAPASMLTYDVAELELEKAVLSSGSTSSIAPTITGDQDNRPGLTISEEVALPDGSTVVVPLLPEPIILPNGTGIDFFPLPMGQLTVGLPLGTDVSARFFPMLSIGDVGEIGMWGVGGKHSISQWIPFIKKVKILDVAVQGGYTKVSSELNIGVEPPDVEIPGEDYDHDGQSLGLDVAGWTVNLIASQKLSVITFYEGIGYASSLVALNLEGPFPIPAVIVDNTDPLNPVAQTTWEVYDDPIDLNYSNINNLRINVGIRLKLSVLTLHYDFTHTLYSTHSAGIGIWLHSLVEISDSEPV